jgi:hypothetical protein
MSSSFKIELPKKEYELESDCQTKRSQQQRKATFGKEEK